ncbi:MAG TPA: ATP synthase F0 subunit B [Clostridia bacterium]|nr:ATP synthase F0 subunit B [Clostridia bacterium]
MKILNRSIFGVILLAFVFAASAPAVNAQHEPAPTVQGESAEHQQAAGDPNAAADSELAHESKEAEGEGGHQAFKQSPMVKRLATSIGIHPAVAYWVFLVLNFVILAIFFYWLLVKKLDLGNTMRARTASIQKGMEEARRASEEANARLAAVQGRLDRLDAEVADIRIAAETDFAAEEARIRQFADEDARRVIVAAEQEIAAAAKSARRELKAYAASIAVDLAAKKIRVDGATDEALVRDFVDQLAPGRDGKDGK